MSDNEFDQLTSINEFWADMENGLISNKMSPRMIKMFKQAYFAGCMATMILSISLPKQMDMEKSEYFLHLEKLTNEIQAVINESLDSPDKRH